MSADDQHPEAARLLRDLTHQAAKRLLAEAGRDGLPPARTSVSTSALDDPDTPLGEVGPDDPVTTWRDDSPTRASIHDELTRASDITMHQDSASPSRRTNPEAQTHLGGHAIDALRARTALVEERLEASVDAEVLVEVRSIRRRLDIAFGVAGAAGMLLSVAMALVAIWLFVQWWVGW